MINVNILLKHINVIPLLYTQSNAKSGTGKPTGIRMRFKMTDYWNRQGPHNILPYKT
jgi:hypothetical protein